MLPIPVRCLCSHKQAIIQDAPQLKKLFHAVNSPNDLGLPQWVHWYAMALEFQPDIILELGRGYGNSTCVFTQAAHRIGGTRVKSFCLTEPWEKQADVAKVVDKNWFSPLELYSGDLTGIDFSPHLAHAERVLLLWDAHGYQVAEHVLAHIMPIIHEKQHLVICHDISDNRVADIPKDYAGKSFWRGMDDYYSNHDSRNYTNLFWLCTIVDQVLPILDFCFRNDIELHSADYEMHEVKTQNPQLINDLTQVLSCEFFSEVTHWAYFTLNESSGPGFFPQLSKDMRKDDG